MLKFIAAVCMMLALCHGACAQVFSHCTEGCPENAECVANKCECLPGYERALSVTTGLPYCRPLCSEPCVPHSSCVAPDRCECAAGHVLDGLGAACVPVRSTTQPPKRTTHFEPTAMSSTTGAAVWSTSTAKFSDVDSEDANDEEFSGAAPIATQVHSTAKPDEQAVGKCPSDYVYEEGDCRPLIRTTADLAHLDVPEVEYVEQPPPSRGYYVWIGVSLIVLAIAVMVGCIARKTNT